jgi:glycosyltransferase involved in cell wall biosynthesis
MKTVLHLSHTDINYDGRILKEMNALMKVGFSVKGIGVNMSEGVAHSSLNEGIDIKSITLLSRTFTLLPKFIMHFLSVIEIIFKMLVSIIKTRPDVIHCHDTIVLPLGVIAKKITKSYLIYDAHELESDRNGLSKKLGQLTLLVEKFLWRFIDSFIVVSPSILNWYRSNIGNKSGAIILNSPIIDEEKNINYEGYLRKSFSIPEDKKIFIYVGILAPGRGLEQIISVFKNDELDACVVFLGYGNLSKEIFELSNQYENIYLHNAVKHEEVTLIVSSADVGLCLVQNVSLSDYFCLPNKLFEYSFSGIPVLASNFPDISQMVKTYQLGICCDLDTASISQAILQFVKSDNEFVICKSTIQPLSWQAQEVRLQNFYRSLLSNK